MSELKPCPFCGGADQLRVSGLYDDPSGFVSCYQCAADGPVSEDHVAAWNRRAGFILTREELEASIEYATDYANEIQGQLSWRPPSDQPRYRACMEKALSHSSRWKAMLDGDA